MNRITKRRTHLGLADGDSDELSAHVSACKSTPPEPGPPQRHSRKESEDESVHETQELSQVARHLPSLERLAVFPVPEPESLLSRHAAEVDDQTEEDESGEGDDLDEAEPELDLPVSLCSLPTRSEDEHD